MRTYLLWIKEGKNGAIMDVTKTVEDTQKLSPQLPRAMIVTALIELLKADEVVLADSEEQMMEMFEKTKIMYSAYSKEDLH